VAYSAQSDVEFWAGSREALVEIADAGNGEVDATIVARAIAVADAEIDSYAQKRYPVPLNPVANIVKEVSAQITVYKLRARRNSQDARDVTAYEQAIKWLDDLATGKVSLGEEPMRAESSQIDAEAMTRDSLDSDDDETVSRNAFKAFV
jgi:phage gp36-like protein